MCPIDMPNVYSSCFLPFLKSQCRFHPAPGWQCPETPLHPQTRRRCRLKCRWLDSDRRKRCGGMRNSDCANSGNQACVFWVLHECTLQYVTINVISSQCWATAPTMLVHPGNLVCATQDMPELTVCVCVCPYSFPLSCPSSCSLSGSPAWSSGSSVGPSFCSLLALSAEMHQHLWGYQGWQERVSISPIRVSLFKQSNPPHHTPLTWGI